MRELRIVFMGTPEFAVGILDAILKNGYNVVGVVTAPDRPAGRGQKLKYSAVKEYAMEKGLTLLQPTNLKDPDFIKHLKDLDANLQVVVAFRMLPEVVWKMPELGTFNLHASLLPDYRGAAPINWAIINGEQKTGVTAFFIDDKIDTGEIILSLQTDIHPDENAGKLHDRLMDLGCEAVVNTLTLIKSGSMTTQIQEESAGLKTAQKLTKDNCRIDFGKPGKEIYNFIRGLSPYPAAWCEFKDTDQTWNVRIYDAAFREEQHEFGIGKIIAGKKELSVAVRDGFLEITSLQFPGKKAMTATELLNGMRFSANATAT